MPDFKRWLLIYVVGGVALCAALAAFWWLVVGLSGGTILLACIACAFGALITITWRYRRAKRESASAQSDRRGEPPV